MYRLIIADDECNIRDGIKNCLDWKAMGFEIIGTYSDGCEIMECLEYLIPDVIITDIKMKQVSGMEIAKFIHTQDIPCKVVLISGFQEFELAVEGIEYGVAGYLSKPLSVDKIQQTFQKLKTDLDKTQNKLKRAEKQKLYLEKMRSFLEKEFFEELTLGMLKDTNDIKLRMQILFPDMDYPSISCLKMDIKILNFDDFLENRWEYGREQLERSIRQFLQERSNPHMYYYLINKKHALLEIIGFSPDFSEDSIESTAEEIRRTMAEAFCVELQCEVTHFYPNIYATEQSVFIEQNSSHLFTSARERRLADQKKLLLSCAATGNGEKAKRILKTISEETQGLPDEISQKILAGMVDDIHQLRKEVGHSGEQIDPAVHDAFCDGKMTVHQIKTYCIRLIDSVQSDSKKGCYSAASIVKNAIDYIDQNIYSDISREEVAQKVFVSPSYLSRIFTQEMGEGFLQYINRRKIEKSIDLLKDPHLKLYEISMRLGYKTPRYYSRLFQAQMGITPKAYRIQLLSQKGPKENEYVGN